MSRDLVDEVNQCRLDGFTDVKDIALRCNITEAKVVQILAESQSPRQILAGRLRTLNDLCNIASATFESRPNMGTAAAFTSLNREYVRTLADLDGLKDPKEEVERIDKDIIAPVVKRCILELIAYTDYVQRLVVENVRSEDADTVRENLKTSFRTAGNNLRAVYERSVRLLVTSLGADVDISALKSAAPLDEIGAKVILVSEGDDEDEDSGKRKKRKKKR